MADDHHYDHHHDREDGHQDGHHGGHRDPADGGRRIREAPLFCVVPLWVTALSCLALFFYADAIYNLLAPIAAQ